MISKTSKSAARLVFSLVLLLGISVASASAQAAHNGRYLGSGGDHALSSYDSGLCQDVADHIHSGDLLYLASGHVFFQKVAKATKSWTAHVGIAMQEANGAWGVYESKLMFSTYTPLCDFLDRAGDDKVAALRYHLPFTFEDLIEIKIQAEARMGLTYDIGFDLDAQDSTFCSKFVYDVMKAALNLEVGQVQTFRDLLTSNPDEDLTFWNAFFAPRGGIPWERRTVTPAAELNDPNWIMVYSHGISDADPGRVH